MLKLSPLYGILCCVFLFGNSSANNKRKIYFNFKEDIELARKRKEEYESKKRGNSNETLYSESFSQATALLKTLVNDMADGKEYSKKYRTILLAGPTGSGKTTLARAIAHRLNREVMVVNAPVLLGHFRNQSAENVKKLFEDLASADPQPILIIDEINALTDDHISEHSDIKQTAMQLWTQLDSFAQHEGFLLIATTNVTKKMPHQLQSRFKGKTFRIDNPPCELRLKTINYYLQQINASKDISCTDEYLQQLSKKTENFSQRDLEALIDRAILLYSHYNPGVPVLLVSSEFLEEAFLQIHEENSVVWDFSEHISAEEKRHNESIELNKDQFRASQELQCKLAKLNLVYQTQMAPITFNNYHPNIQESTKVLNKSFKMVFPKMGPIANVKEKTNEHNMIDAEFEVVDFGGN